MPPIPEDTRHTRYGQYNDNPTPEQLEAYFTLNENDLNLIAQCRSDHTKLGMAVQLCTLRFLGTILPNPLDVPETVVRHLEAQLHLNGVQLDRYVAARETRFDHARLIREHLGYHEFDTVAWLRVTRLLYSRLLVSDEKTDVLFDAITSDLVQGKIVLPGATTISRLIARVRERITVRLYRQLAERLNSRQAERLEALLVVPTNDHKSPLVRLRVEPTRISTPGLLTALERLERIRAVGVGGIDLTDLPQTRLSAISKHALGVWAATIAKYGKHRRLGSLLMLVQDLERHVPLSFAA